MIERRQLHEARLSCTNDGKSHSNFCRGNAAVRTFSHVVTSVLWSLINCCLVVAILAYVPVSMFGHGTMWQKVVVLVAFVWLLLLCGQIIFVFRTGRVFEFQMYRFQKLHKELLARDRKRNR